MNIGKVKCFLLVYLILVGKTGSLKKNSENSCTKRSNIGDTIHDTNCLLWENRKHLSLTSWLTDVYVKHNWTALALTGIQIHNSEACTHISGVLRGDSKKQQQQETKETKTNKYFTGQQLKYLNDSMANEGLYLLKV